MKKSPKTSFLGSAHELMPSIVSFKDYQASNNIGVNMSGQHFENCDYAGSVIRELKLNNTSCKLVDFSATLANALSAKKSNFVLSNFSRSTLENANFTGSHFSHVSFIGANLEEANFKDTKFDKGVLFVGAKISPALRAYLSSKGAITSIDDFQKQEKLYTQSELIFIKNVLTLAEKEINGALAASDDIGSGYLTPSHHDQVINLKQYIESLLEITPNIQKRQKH